MGDKSALQEWPEKLPKLNYNDKGEYQQKTQIKSHCSIKRDKSLLFFFTFLGELQRMASSLSNPRRLTINLEENQARFIYKSGSSIFTRFIWDNPALTQHMPPQHATSFPVTCKACFYPCSLWGAHGKIPLSPLLANEPTWECLLWLLSKLFCKLSTRESCFSIIEHFQNYKMENKFSFTQ